MAAWSSTDRPLSSPSLRRRTLLGGSLAAAGALGAGLHAGPFAPAAHADDPGEEHLGTPITGVTAAATGFTADSSGRVMEVLIAGGGSSVFSAIDALTGELLMSQVVDGVTQGRAFKTVEDGSVYIGTQSNGRMFRFTPNSLELEELSTGPVFDQGHMWCMAITDDQQVYVGTYPDGKVLQYDPSTDKWSDHGQLVPGAQYVRSLATDGSMLYAGTGTLARIMRLDPASGETSEITLPDDLQDEEFVYDLDVAGELLFARLKESHALIVYDLASEEWVDRIEDGLGLHVSGESVLRTESGRRRVAYYNTSSSPVMAYDLDTGDKIETTLHLGGSSNRDWSWQELGARGFPGESLLTGISDGTVKAFNPITHETLSVTADAEGSPYEIRSLAAGPNGEIFVGGYLSPRELGVADPDTGEVTQFPWSGQVEGMTAQGDDVLFGIYPGGGIRKYDTTQEFDLDTNPGPSVAIGEQQDRPVTLTPAGDLTAIGSVPGYGQLGGALTLLDRATEEMDVYRHVVPDQSVVALLHQDGVLYGGSAIWGGLGIEPTASDAELFAFDLDTREVLFSVVPVPGETSIGGLTFDDSGTLWGFGTNTLFSFDIAAQEVTESQTYFDHSNEAEYVTGHELFWHEGLLLGSAAATIFTVDPQTWELTTIADDKVNLALDRHGNYYYSKRGDLFRWIP